MGGGGEAKKKLGNKRGVVNFLSGGTSEITNTSINATKDIGEKSGAYTPASEKKDEANRILSEQNATALAEQTALEQSEKERKKRNSLFQATGGSVSVGGRNTIYGN